VKWKETNLEEANAFMAEAKRKFCEIGELGDEDVIKVVRSIGLVMVKKK